MDKVTTMGIELAKRVFALHGVDAAGRVVPRKTVRREQFVETVTFALNGVSKGAKRRLRASVFERAAIRHPTCH